MTIPDKVEEVRATTGQSATDVSFVNSDLNTADSHPQI
jgi:hypothetical protein